MLFPGPPLHLLCFFGTARYSQGRFGTRVALLARRVSGTGRAGGARVRPQPIEALACSSERTLLPSARRVWELGFQMDRPVPSRALGQRPPALSVLATPTPSSGAASTIYVSSSAGAPAQHHQLRHAHPTLQSDAGGATLRRGPKRAARGAPEESPVLWSPVSAAKPPGPDRNGHGASPGLGASPDDRDSSTASPTASAGHSRKKQKRNKPTLSCFECVERKTKVCEIYVVDCWNTNETELVCPLTPLGMMSFHPVFVDALCFNFL